MNMFGQGALVLSLSLWNPNRLTMKTELLLLTVSTKGRFALAMVTGCRLLYFLVPLELLMLLVLLDIIINLIFLVHEIPFGLW